MKPQLQNKSTVAALTRSATDPTLELWSSLAGSLHMGLGLAAAPGFALGGCAYLPFCAIRTNDRRENQEGCL